MGPQSRTVGGVVSRLLKYVEDNGDARVPAPYKVDGYPLGRWVIKQRARFAAGTFDAERRDRLKNLNGWMWHTTKDGMWEEWFSRLLKYVEDNGDARVPAPYKVDGYPLGRWVIKQRAKHAEANLPADRRDRLDELPGWTWNSSSSKWEEGYLRLLTYIETNGHARIKAAFKTEDGYRLGQWVTVQRQDRTRGSLEADRQQRLQDIPEWTWDPITDLWEEGFRHAQEYAKLIGHTNVPQPHVADDGYPLGSWVSTQRSAYRKNALPANRVQRLKDLTGWTWDPRAAKWPKGFGILQEYFAANGTTRVPQNYKTPDGFPLGTWVATQRSDYRKGAMPADRITLLENLGDWTWDIRG
jgi:hypothetical protein